VVLPVRARRFAVELRSVFAPRERIASRATGPVAAFVSEAEGPVPKSPVPLTVLGAAEPEPVGPTPL